jgi:LuxR family transcriptional regulator of csgAB operon
MQPEHSTEPGTISEPLIIHIIGAERQSYGLLTTFLQTNLNAKCVLFPAPLLNTSEMVSDSIGNSRIWLIDSIRLNADQLGKKFDDFVASLPENEFVALFNVDQKCQLEGFIRRNKIRGIFYTSDTLEVFQKGIHTILDGQLWISRKLLSNCIMASYESPPLFNDLDKYSLTGREAAILMYLASGASNQDIAVDLSISEHTVKTHLYKIYRKIGVTNRLQATRWVNSRFDER